MRSGVSLFIAALFAATVALVAPIDAARAKPPLSPAPVGAGADWSPERATGPRDVFIAGDNVNAWATAQADKGAEWLRLTYREAMPVREIRIWQNDAPGAITRVTALVDGREVELWSGTDQIAAGAKAPVEKVVTLPKPQITDTVTLYLDTARVAGWNEIDAVEIVAADGRRAWASGAVASSSYASPISGHPLSHLVGQMVSIRVEGVTVGGVIVAVDHQWITLDEGGRRRLISPARVGFIEWER